MELHEGTSREKLAKRDLIRSHINNIKLEKGEFVENLQARFKELINGYQSISGSMSNRNMLREPNQCLPKVTTMSLYVWLLLYVKKLWGKYSRWFFTIMELDESRLVGLVDRRGIYMRNNLILASTQKKDHLESLSNSSSWIATKRLFSKKNEKVFMNSNFNRQKAKKLRKKFKVGERKR